MASKNKDVVDRIKEALLKFETKHVYNINLETRKLLEDARGEVLELRKRLIRKEEPDDSC